MSFSSVAWASPDFVCSLLNAKRVIAIAQNHATYDKNRHCTASCMLALKCNHQEVMMAGLLKEFRDLLGYGEPSQEDLEANAFGIALAAKHAATTDAQCLSQCDLYYHP